MFNLRLFRPLNESWPDFTFFWGGQPVHLYYILSLVTPLLQIECPGHGKVSGETILSTGSTVALISFMLADQKCWRERDNFSSRTLLFRLRSVSGWTTSMMMGVIWSLWGQDWILEPPVLCQHRGLGTFQHKVMPPTLRQMAEQETPPQVLCLIRQVLEIGLEIIPDRVP